MVTTAEFNVTAEVPTVAVTCATAPATLLARPEVAHARDLPIRVRDRPYVTLGGKDHCAVHEVNVVLACARVAPQEVGFPVAIEVADAGHGPIEICHGTQIPFASKDCRTVHRIEVVLAGRGIAPQDVRAPSASKIVRDGFQSSTCLDCRGICGTVSGSVAGLHGIAIGRTGREARIRVRRDIADRGDKSTAPVDLVGNDARVVA